MDWERERYVRLYTRDTVTWSLWSWQARAIFVGILRKVDRAGVMGIGRNEPARAVAALVGIPLDVVEAHLPDVLDSGAIVIEDCEIVLPNYVEAQEAKKPEAQRKTEERERTKDKKARNSRKGADKPVRNQPDPSHGVTTSHTASQNVTPSLAEPSLAEPSLASYSSSASPPTREAKKTTKPAIAIPPEAAEVAQYLYDAICSHSPDTYASLSPKRQLAKVTGWADHIRLAIQQDGRTPDQLRRVIDYAHRSDDHFWRPNLLSGKTLRAKYAQLSIKATVHARQNAGPLNHAPGEGFDYVGYREKVNQLIGRER